METFTKAKIANCLLENQPMGVILDTFSHAALKISFFIPTD